MKTFVINLPSAKERLTNISKQLNNLWIKYEVFPAIYWKSLTKKELENLYDNKKAKEYLWRDLTLWEVGCALSHYLLFKKIVEENIDLALVLEDDAIISKNIKQIYKKLNNKLEKNDYVLLSYSIFDKDELKKYWWYIYNNFFKKWKIIKSIIHCLWMLSFSILDYFLIFLSKIFWPFIIKKYKPQYSTVWYFITKEWAKKLLKIHDKIFLPSDLLPEKFWKSVLLKFSISIPRIISRDDNIFNSCIDALWKRKQEKIL